MPFFRRFAAALTVLAASALVVPQAANAAGPTAPYDAFTVEGGQFSGVFDGSNSQITSVDQSSATYEGYEMTIVRPEDGRRFTVGIPAPESTGVFSEGTFASRISIFGNS